MGQIVFKYLAWSNADRVLVSIALTAFAQSMIHIYKPYIQSFQQNLLKAMPSYPWAHLHAVVT